MVISEFHLQFIKHIYLLIIISGVSSDYDISIAWELVHIYNLSTIRESVYIPDFSPTLLNTVPRPPPQLWDILSKKYKGSVPLNPNSTQQFHLINNSPGSTQMSCIYKPHPSVSYILMTQVAFLFMLAVAINIL